MNEVIKIETKEINGEQTNSVSARDLHEFLESKQDFSDWIKNRIEKYNFAQGIDFIKFPKIMELGIKPRIEYYLTLDVAKELSMVENNEKGRQARLYFISCEKKLREVAIVQVPTSLKDALKLAYEQQCLLEEKEKALTAERERVEHLTPKAQFYDQAMSSTDTLAMDEVAKVLNLGFGRNKLFELLRDHKVLMNNNQPYQAYIDRGYFKIVEQTFDKPSGKTGLNLKTVVLQKGVAFIRKLAAGDLQEKIDF